MNLTGEFRKSDDFEKMGALVSGMRNMVIQMSGKGKKPSPVTEEMWRGFIDSLIENVEEAHYWTVALEEPGLPGDESVEFTQFPTAVALAALALDQAMFPQVLSEAGTLIFQKAASRFSLEGYGEDSIFQICEILLIFIEGDLPAYLRKSSQAPELLEQLDQWRDNFSSKIETGDTILPFGGDYKEIYQLILKGLGT